MFSIQFKEFSQVETGTVVLGVFLNDLQKALSALEKKYMARIHRAAEVEDFKGNVDEVCSVLAPGDGRVDRIILIGLGEREQFQDCNAVLAGGHAAVSLKTVTKATVVLPGLDEHQIIAFVRGICLGNFRFDHYQTRLSDREKKNLQFLVIQVDNPEAVGKSWDLALAEIKGVYLARELVSEPSNILTPEEFVRRLALLRSVGVDITVLDEAAMKKLGFGAFLGVAQGSAMQPYTVIMRFNGADNNVSPISFIGKGVTFDSGGISIKPATGMEEMKTDMGGAAVVTGLLYTLASRRAKVNAIGVIGLVENMPSGTAQRPGDVVRSYSGQTIEVINTDAEGRLVLADLLSYVQKTYSPRYMVDLATLTGAIVISLGHDHAGLFSNDESLSHNLIEAGEKTGEKLWRMPMGESYDRQLKSNIADMKNIGTRAGGSITAAQFLERFVDKTPWAHLDIAGVTWASEESSHIIPKGGATGFGVRLLNRMVQDNYEEDN